MMRPVRLVLCILLVFAVSSGSGRQEADIEDFENRLARVRKQIDDLKTRLREEEKREASLLSSLQKLRLGQRLIRNEMAEVDLQLKQTNRELAVLKDSADQMRTRLEEQRRAVQRTLVTLYKFGRIDFLQFALRSEDLESLIVENKRLGILARYQDELVSGFQKTLTEIRETEARLEEKRRDLSKLRDLAAAKKRELEAEERKTQDLIRRIQRDRATHLQVLQELEENARQLQIMMKKIADQEWTLPSPFVPFFERKGRLSWPVEGKVITRFGPEKHPRFRTTTMNNGIEIAPASEKAVVLALHAGKIVYADAFEGYGKLLIIDHGMAYFSLYGHCSEFLAAKGDIVREGQPIAVVGDSGSLKGECLYLEIRHRAKALDPLQWLNRR
ncbi:MAG: peptidoglycan DD-metalloendopeptidase family protein [Acidobacteriota bacterium]|nr:peptidoglycan DD-metalloendopeptidase family protein [Acidobacteriota bacterium]